MPFREGSTPSIEIYSSSPCGLKYGGPRQILDADIQLPRVAQRRTLVRSWESSDVKSGP